jgi:hypothetical protein
MTHALKFVQSTGEITKSEMPKSLPESKMENHPVAQRHTSQIASTLQVVAHGRVLTALRTPGELAGAIEEYRFQPAGS